MQAAAGRDRIYVLTLVLTLVAICAFGVFIIRDYQDQGSQRVNLARIGGVSGGSAGADAQLPGSGESASAAQGSTGASAGGTGLSGASVSGSTGGGRATAPVGGPAAAAGAPAAAAAAPGGTSPACVNGHMAIGQIVAITGPITEQTVANATAAYFKKVNREGGINGCQVDFTYLDDAGLDQQKAAADARELVQADNVFAVVGGFQPITATTTEPYFRKQGVPVVGIDGTALEDYNSPVAFSFACSPAGFGVSTINEANRLGFKRIAVFYVDFALTQASFAALKDQAAKNGQTVVYSNAENISSATYGTDVVAAKNANPDAVINILDANSAVREINAMNSNGWYPNLVGTTSTSDPVVIQQGAGWFGHPGHSVYVARNYLPANRHPRGERVAADPGAVLPRLRPQLLRGGGVAGGEDLHRAGTQAGGGAHPGQPGRRAQRAAQLPHRLHPGHHHDR